MTIRASEGPDDRRVPPAALVLGWAGVIPFAAGALALWFTGERGMAHTLMLPLLAYGGIILSFLGGVRWALAFRVRPEDRQAKAFAFSILPALVAWVGVGLYHHPLVAFGLLAGAHIVQGWFDVTTAEADSAPPWYPRLRLQLTAAAVLALGIAAGAVATLR